MCTRVTLFEAMGISVLATISLNKSKNVIFLSWLKQSSREQLAIGAFAQSLLIIPNTLAVNAAKDATDLVPKLRAYHHSSQVKTEHCQLKYYGLDLIEGKSFTT